MYSEYEAVRFLSSILFAFMAMVLPMAGMQQYFCTAGMVFVDKAGECPVKQSERNTEEDTEGDADCCGTDHKQESPDCMTVSKAIPDGNLTEPFTVPTSELETTVAEIVGLSDDSHPEKLGHELVLLRGPPGSESLFLMQQRWLI